MPLEPSSYAARPSLGSSVDAVLRGWRGAAQASSAPAQRIRALLTTGQVGEWEFAWSGGDLHRILAAGVSHPATASEQELLRKCIVHGWFFVYLAREGQEPIVLHAVGIDVQDSPESPLFSPQATPQWKGISRQKEGRVGEIGMPDDTTPRHERPSPIPAECEQNHTGKCPAFRRRPLLLLSGAVVGSGVIGWRLTRRSEIGIALALVVLIVLGRTIIRAVPKR